MSDLLDGSPGGIVTPECRPRDLKRGRTRSAPPAASREARIWRLTEVTLTASRLVLGQVARQCPAVRRGADPSGTVPPTADFVAHCGAGSLRPLRLNDESAWTQTRRLNAERMRPWWTGCADWLEATGHDAFLDHYVSWGVKRRRGSGIDLAMLLNGSLVGEMTLTSQHEGRAVGLGMWALPEFFSNRATWGVVGSLFDELFFRRGVVRMDAPVAVGNDNPRGLLTLAGFRREGTMAQWRPLGDAMVDHDLFGLTRDRWLEVRRNFYPDYRWELHPAAQTALLAAEADADSRPPHRPGGRAAPR